MRGGLAQVNIVASSFFGGISGSAAADTASLGSILIPMMVLNCGIGLLTPPVGAVLFIGSAVAKRPMEKVVRATLPFYLCMIIALLLISFIPQISLWLPQLTGAL